MTDVSAYEVEVLRAMRWIELFSENDPITLAAVRNALPRQRHGHHAAHTPAAVAAYAPRALFKSLSEVARAAMSSLQSAVDGQDRLEATLQTMRKRDLVYIVQPVRAADPTTYHLGSTGRRYIMHHQPDMRNRFEFEQAALERI